MTLICKHCKGDNVMSPKWIDPNNGELKLNQSGMELLSDWCLDCESETTLVDDGYHHYEVKD